MIAVRRALRLMRRSDALPIRRTAAEDGTSFDCIRRGSLRAAAVTGKAALYTGPSAWTPPPPHTYMNPFSACMFEKRRSALRAVSLACISHFVDGGSGLRGGGGGGGGGGGFRSGGGGGGGFGRCRRRRLGGDRGAFGILLTCRQTMAEIRRDDSKRPRFAFGRLLEGGAEVRPSGEMTAFTRGSSELVSLVFT